MRNWIMALMAGATLITATTTSTAAEARDRSPQAQLARAIEGRVAGKPVNCINLNEIRSSRIIDGTAIVYEMTGGKIYVNTPTSGASSLRWGRALVTDTHSPQLCSVDIVRLFDTGIRMPAGSVGLGQFVPYTKVKKGG